MLEPGEEKLSSPVLRGPGRSNPARPPDHDIGKENSHGENDNLFISWHINFH